MSDHMLFDIAKFFEQFRYFERKNTRVQEDDITSSRQGKLITSDKRHVSESLLLHPTT